MIDGITILNVYEYQVAGNVLVGLIIIIFVIIGFVGMLYNVGISKWKNAIVFTMIFVIAAGLGFKIPAVMTTRYEVLVDESVSLDDVIKEFNIIEHRGKILVIEDKETHTKIKK